MIKQAFIFVSDDVIQIQLMYLCFLWKLHTSCRMACSCCMYCLFSFCLMSLYPTCYHYYLLHFTHCFWSFLYLEFFAV